LNALKYAGAAPGTEVRGSSLKIVGTSIRDDMQKSEHSNAIIFRDYLTRYWYVANISQAGMAKNLSLLAGENILHFMKVGMICRSA